MSQNGKDYAKSKFAARIRNNKKKRTKEQHKTLYPKTEKPNKDRRAKRDHILHSQFGKDEIYSIFRGTPESILDSLAPLWCHARELGQKYCLFSFPNWKLTEVRDYLIEEFPKIKRSELFAMVVTLLQFVVTLGWLSKIEITVWGLEVFKIHPLNRSVSIFDILEGCWKLLSAFWSRVSSALESNNIAAFWDSPEVDWFEDMYTTIIAELPLIEVGRSASLSHAAFDRHLHECIEHCRIQQKICSKGEKPLFTKRLLDLKKVEVARLKQKKGSLRCAPFAVLFAGESSVGKTCMANGIGRAIAQWGGYDSSEDACFSMNEQDKFMSGIGNHHKIIRIDDLCQTKPEKCTENPLEKIIMLCNNQPMPATVAEAELKGQIMLDPRVVTATTNIWHLNSPSWLVEPLAGMRRFQLHVEQSVKPEYRKEGSHMLDSNKVAHMKNMQFPTYALFTLYTVDVSKDDGTTKKNGVQKSLKKTVIEFEGKRMENVEIEEFCKCTRTLCKTFYKQQEDFVAGQKNMAEMELCQVCDMPTQMCCCNDELHSQLSLSDITYVKDWFLNLENDFCSWIESLLQQRINSFTGQAILFWLNRAIFYETAQQAALAVFVSWLFLVRSEILFGDCGLIPFSCVVLCASMYVFEKYARTHRALVIRATTIPRVSTYLSSMNYSTLLKILALFGGMATWKILAAIARKWHATLPVTQSSDPSVEMKAEEVNTNGAFEKNEKDYQKADHPWWGDVGRNLREKMYTTKDIKVTEASATITPDRLMKMIEKKQCIIQKKDGEFTNAFPMESNYWAVPNHLIGESPEEVVIKRPSGNVCTVMLDPHSTERVSGEDFSVWYLPEMGSQKDMTGYLLPTKLTKEKSIPCRMVYNESNAVTTSEPFSAWTSLIVTDKGGMFRGIKYTFPTSTFGGMCMGTVVSTVAGKSSIVGFHLAGKNHTGAAGMLALDAYTIARDKLAKRPGVLSSHSATPFDTKIMNVDVGPLVTPHEKCVTHDLPTSAKINIIGQHNQPRGSPSSHVVTSVISDSVEKVMGIPKQHGPPKGMGDKRHLEVDIAGKVNTVYKVDQKRLERSYLDYITSILKNIPKKELKQVVKMSDDANLNGLDGVLGINSINFASSIGFPLKGKKSKICTDSDRHVEGITCVRDIDPMVWEEVARLEKQLLAGKRINTVFKGARKDEPTKLSKDKVRVFAACNTAMILLTRKYFLSLAALVQRNQKLFECAVGVVQQSPEWTELFEHIGKYGWERAIAGDYAKFDATMSCRFMLAAFKILIEVARQSGNYTEDDLKIMTGLATEITYPTYDYFGTLVQFFGSNPSGHPLTVIINSLVNSLYMRYAYYTIAEEDRWWKVPLFREIVALMTYGDDNIMTVKKGYKAVNHTRIAAVFSAMGIKYTMADKDAESVPYIHLSTASFLKHFAVWDEEMKLYRCPVEEGSIAKMLHAHLKSDVLTKEQSAAEAIKNVALKKFEFGREEYTKTVSQLEQVAKDSGIFGYLEPIPSYEERMQWYKEKFQLSSQSGWATKTECFNPEEERLQQECIKAINMRCTAKEYVFPGGLTGDLYFEDGGNSFGLVVEVKCAKRGSKKSKYAEKQARRIGLAMQILYEKNCICTAIYDYDGFHLLDIHFGAHMKASLRSEVTKLILGLQK